MMKKLSFVFTLLMLVASCADNNVQPEKKAQLTSVVFNATQLKNSGITEEIPSQRIIGNAILATGTVEVPPQNKTVISATFGGFIRSLDVLDGMLVKKGQVLLRVENPELISIQQEYLEVIANMEYLQSEKERQQLLVDKDAGTMKSFQSAKAQLAVAKAKKSGLQAKLEMAGINMLQLNQGTIQKQITIRAPFNGAVTKINVEVGAYMNLEDHLLEIIDLQHAHAEVTVFEKDAQLLEIGQAVELNFPGEIEKVHSTIFLIGKEIGKDRTVKVHCHFKKENKNIPPGAYFKAVIHTKDRKLLAVPSESIVELNGKNVVFRGVDDSKGGKRFIPIEVKILATENEWSAIESVDKNRKINYPVVRNGAYAIYSSYILASESE
jgi:cobalt-zinc-cadmium efflux system membrane fusion protein